MVMAKLNNVNKKKCRTGKQERACKEIKEEQLTTIHQNLFKRNNGLR